MHLLKPSWVWPQAHGTATQDYLRQPRSNGMDKKPGNLARTEFKHTQLHCDDSGFYQLLGSGIGQAVGWLSSLKLQVSKKIENFQRLARFLFPIWLSTVWCLRGAKVIMGDMVRSSNICMQLWSWIILYPLSLSIVIFLSWITVTMVTAMQIATEKKSILLLTSKGKKMEIEKEM